MLSELKLLAHVSLADHLAHVDVDYTRGDPFLHGIVAQVDLTALFLVARSLFLVESGFARELLVDVSIRTRSVEFKSLRLVLLRATNELDGQGERLDDISMHAVDRQADLAAHLLSPESLQELCHLLLLIFNYLSIPSHT